MLDITCKSPENLTREERYQRAKKLMKETFKVKKLDPNAVIPTYKHEGDSGMDVRSIEDVVIRPGDSVAVDTGLSFVIPMGTEIQVRPRSGLALKNKITVLNTPGTIDSSYRGTLKVILINHSQKEFHVTEGMRIAQIVFCPVIQVDKLVEVLEVDETIRNDKGFGSTGIY